ncbi:MAG: hypothetical protein R3F46_04250 [bacterium]
MAQLPDEEPIPARPSGVSDLAYADQVAAALNEQSGLISDEDQPAFRAGLAGVLDLLEGEQRQPEEALAIAWRIECSADNLRGRSAARWPEVGALVCSRSREVQAALLRRIGDMQLVQEALFERFMALDGVPDDELEKLAGELLPEAELAGLIEDLLSDVRLSGNPLSGAAMLLSVAGLAARLPDPELYLELREELEEFGAELPEDPALYSS